MEAISPILESTSSSNTPSLTTDTVRMVSTFLIPTGPIITSSSTPMGRISTHHNHFTTKHITNIVRIRAGRAPHLPMAATPSLVSPQPLETHRSNNAQRSNGNSPSSHSGPSNGDVSMERDMAMETETDMDTEMHHDPQPSPNKGKDKATKAPKDDKCNDKAVDGSPENVKMDIIHETGRADPTKNRKRGRPVGSKNKPKSKPDGQSSEFNEAEATKPKGKANKALKPKGTTKDSKPTDGTKCRANKRACNHAIEDEVDQLKEEDDQDDTDKPEPSPRRTLPLNDDHPSGSGGIPPDSPSNPGGPGGPGGPPSGLNDSNYNSSGPSGSPPGTPSNPGNPGGSHPPGGPDDSIDGPPQDHGYRYGGEGTTGGTGTTPPGSPIPPNALLLYTPTVDTQLREFMNFMLCHQDSNGAVFHPQRGLVCYECHNQQQFQTFCNEFSATFGNPTNVFRMNILNGYRFEMRIKLDFHWTNKHLIRLSNMLQDVRTLYRLDLHVCTAEEINASRLKSPSKKCKITRTTCCTSELMDLIHRNPNIREVRFRGVGTFFIRDFTHVPTMSHVRVLEMDVDAWVPLQRYASEAHPAQNPAPYCKRFDQVLLKLSRLELLVLHCPDAPGAFMERLVEMKPMMSILSHAKNIQHQPQIQRGGFLVRLKAHGTASAFEIGRLDADGNMTDVHAVFTNGDHANVRHWITDSRVPETSAFRGLFDHSTLWSHVERLTTTGRMPVWCMDALKARKNQDQMTQLHGMALQSIAVENEWWGHFLDFLASLQLQIFVLRDCAFPGNMLRAAEEPIDWTWLFDAVGQQGQVIGLGLVDTRFGDGGELLLKEFWNLVDAREIQEQNAEGQMVSVPRPRWGALKWVDISGSVDTDIVGWGMYRLFLDSQEVRNFHGVHVMDPDHFIF
ncbi:hypothetical protein BG000_010000 [Podila horticola]|nr:hypothetical protein BG000_010000 [Podila horticola]